MPARRVSHPHHHQPPKVEQIWSATRDDAELLHLTTADGSWAELELGRAMVTERSGQLWQLVGGKP